MSGVRALDPQTAADSVLDRVRRTAADARCTSIAGMHAVPDGADFAARVGATERHRDIRSLLTLERARISADPVAGYRLLGWTAAAPDALVASYARAREAINDAPRTSDEEWARWDVARVREFEDALERRRMETHVTVALGPDTDVVAFTDLRMGSNHAIRRVNDRLGFEPVATCTTCLLELAPARPYLPGS